MATPVSLYTVTLTPKLAELFQTTFAELPGLVPQPASTGLAFTLPAPHFFTMQAQLQLKVKSARTPLQRRAFSLLRQSLTASYAIALGHSRTGNAA